MKAILVEFTPTEALHVVAIMGQLARARAKRHLPAGLDLRIARKVDIAVLQATEPDHLHLGNGK